MGYAYCIGQCLFCRKTFNFNPVYVPSLRVNGTKEPVCERCITEANVKRKERGNAPLTIHPEAYEPCPEEELA